jgi:hypothetical protein
VHYASWYATLYHVSLDELCVQSFTQSGGTALNNDTCSLESFDLGFSAAFTTGDDGT